MAQPPAQLAGPPALPRRWLIATSGLPCRRPPSGNRCSKCVVSSGRQVSIGVEPRFEHPDPSLGDFRAESRPRQRRVVIHDVAGRPCVDQRRTFGRAPSARAIEIASLTSLPRASRSLFACSSHLFEASRSSDAFLYSPSATRLSESDNPDRLRFLSALSLLSLAVSMLRLAFRPPRR